MRKQPLRDVGNRMVVVVEPNFRGHRLSYVNLIANYSSQHDLKCYLASSAPAFVSAEYEIHMKDHCDSVGVISLGEIPQTGIVGYHAWLLQQLKRLRRQWSRAAIVVLEGDKAAPFIALAPFSIKNITLLVMRAPKREGNARDLLRDMLKRLGMLVMKARGARVLVLSPATFAAISYKYRGYPAVPDPIDVCVLDRDIEAYKSSLNPKMTEDRSWIGVFGHVARRKNLDLIIRAASKMSPMPGVLISGAFVPGEFERVLPDIESFKRRGGVVVLDTRLLSDWELNAAIASVDVVAVAHSSEGPSGILGKAVALGVPVAASGARSLKADIDRLSAGYWSALVAADMATAFALAIENGKLSQRELANGTHFAKALLEFV